MQTRVGESPEIDPWVFFDHLRVSGESPELVSISSIQMLSMLIFEQTEGTEPGDKNRTTQSLRAVLPLKPK